MSKRKTAEEIIAKAASLGFLLLSNHSEYKTNKTNNLSFRFINCIHTFTSALGELWNKAPCQACFPEHRKRKALPKTFAKINTFLDQMGGKLITGPYKKPWDVHIWECKRGHQFKKSWANLCTNIDNQTEWCTQCFQPGRNLGITYYAEEAKENGFIPIDPSEYVNSEKPIRWKCPVGHEISLSCVVLKMSYWCEQCSVDKSFKTIVDACTLKNGKILTDRVNFSNKKTLKHKFQCSEDHTWTTSCRTVIAGHWCKICSTRGRESQLLIYNKIKEVYPDALNEETGLLKSPRLELDIWIPSLKIAIEIDGEYWHEIPSVAKRDLRKNKEAKNAGIFLIRSPWLELFKKGKKGTLGLKALSLNNLLGLLAQLSIEKPPLKKEPFTFYSQVMC